LCAHVEASAALVEKVFAHSLQARDVELALHRQRGDDRGQKHLTQRQTGHKAAHRTATTRVGDVIVKILAAEGRARKSFLVLAKTAPTRGPGRQNECVGITPPLCSSHAFTWSAMLSVGWCRVVCVSARFRLGDSCATSDYHVYVATFPFNQLQAHFFKSRSTPLRTAKPRTLPLHQ